MGQIKQPSERLVYAYDFTAKLGGQSIASIVSVVSTARGDGADLVAIDQAIAGNAVNVEWQGGVDGETYATTVTILDDVNEQIEIDGEISVVDLAFTLPTGISTLYLTAEEFVARFGLEEIVRLTDVAGVGRVDPAMLGRALTDAQALVDVYCGARYAVPLSPVPAIVKLVLADIARARLYPQGAPEGIATSATAAMQMLANISKGQTSIPSTEILAETQAPSAAPVLFEPGHRRYGRGRGGCLDGY